jgi:hypothetical protein
LLCRLHLVLLCRLHLVLLCRLHLVLLCRLHLVLLCRLWIVLECRLWLVPLCRLCLVSTRMRSTCVKVPPHVAKSGQFKVRTLQSQSYIERLPTQLRRPLMLTAHRQLSRSPMS